MDKNRTDEKKEIRHIKYYKETSGGAIEIHDYLKEDEFNLRGWEMMAFDYFKLFYQLMKLIPSSILYRILI